jgi:Ca-activated chloride channel family protein
MSFLSPWFLLGLLLLPLAVGIWLLAERRRMRYAVRYPNVDVLATVVPTRSWLRLVAPVIFLAALAALLLALARPQVSRTVVKDKATVILVLDTSRSMQAKDVKPTRLAAAQEAIRTFLDRAPDDLRVGLVVFAGEAQIATPPTTDHELVEQAVAQADSFLIYGGTAIGDSLQTAVELGRQIIGEPQGEGDIAAGDLRGTRSLAQSRDAGEGDESPVSILFLSDGAQTRGVLQPLDGAALAKEAGIPVYTVALGTPEGVVDRGAFGGFGGQDPTDQNQLIPVPPDPVTLNAIAETTGGEFSEARTADALEKAYANLGSRLGREPGKVEITFLLVALGAGLFVLAGLVAAALEPRLP